MDSEALSSARLQRREMHATDHSCWAGCKRTMENRGHRYHLKKSMRDLHQTVVAQIMKRNGSKHGPKMTPSTADGRFQQRGWALAVCGLGIRASKGDSRSRRFLIGKCACVGMGTLSNDTRASRSQQPVSFPHVGSSAARQNSQSRT